MPEKFLQLRRAFIAQHTAENIQRVIHGPTVRKIKSASRCALPRIPGTKYQPPDTRMHQGCRAHRTGLQGDDQRDLVESPAPDRRRRLAERSANAPPPAHDAHPHTNYRVGDPEMLAKIMEVDPYFVTQVCAA